MTDEELDTAIANRFKEFAAACKENAAAKTAERDERKKEEAEARKCQSCGSDRTFTIYAHSKDLNDWEYKGKKGQGYLPYVGDLFGGDDVHMTVCLECGQVQGTFPVEDPEDDEDDDYND